MNKLEHKMVDTLKDLKENHHVLGIKAEFEAEGTRLEEALRLKEVVTKAGLDLTIKIGGCEAIKETVREKIDLFGSAGKAWLQLIGDYYEWY